ncbi:MAG: fumarylacetoacetate hydrolase family protein [Alphaproteobacteria bacterium]
MSYIFDPAPVTALPVEGSSALFPVRRAFCVGRNYVAHAAEMGTEVDREAPFYFLKASEHIARAEGMVPMASRTEDYHHEIELVVALGSGGNQIAACDALGHVFGYGVGLDMTRRDLQSRSKDRRRPWDTGKNVERSGLCSPLRPAQAVADPARGRIELRVNGRVTQEGDLSEHVWRIEEIIADLSTLYTLQPGDLIFMGTPAGVGPVVAGDVLEGSVEGVGDFRLTIGEALY